MLRVTHPFHPLTGRQLEWVEERFSATHERRVQYHDERGHLQSMPSSWTSLGEDDLEVLVAAGRAHLRLADLIRLSELLARIGR